jgi:hypothetical protein
MFIVLKGSSWPKRAFRFSIPQKRLCPCLLSCCLALVIATVCQGAAFSITELGARAAGMGTAFVGKADDRSAPFYNPTGIAFQPGTHLEMDNSVVVGLFRFTPSATPVGQVVPENGYSQNIKPHFIPLAFLYATKEVSPRIAVPNFNDSDSNLTKLVGRFAGTRVRLHSYWVVGLSPRIDRPNRGDRP